MNFPSEVLTLPIISFNPPHIVILSEAKNLNPPTHPMRIEK